MTITQKLIKFLSMGTNCWNVEPGVTLERATVVEGSQRRRKVRFVFEVSCAIDDVEDEAQELMKAAHDKAVEFLNRDNEINVQIGINT